MKITSGPPAADDGVGTLKWTAASIRIDSDDLERLYDSNNKLIHEK